MGGNGAPVLQSWASRPDLRGLVSLHSATTCPNCASGTCAYNSSSAGQAGRARAASAVEFERAANLPGQRGAADLAALATLLGGDKGQAGPACASLETPLARVPGAEGRVLGEFWQLLKRRSSAPAESSDEDSSVDALLSRPRAISLVGRGSKAKADAASRGTPFSQLHTGIAAVRAKLHTPCARPTCPYCTR